MERAADVVTDCGYFIVIIFLWILLFVSHLGHSFDCGKAGYKFFVSVVLIVLVLVIIIIP